MTEAYRQHVIAQLKAVQIEIQAFLARGRCDRENMKAVLPGVWISKDYATLADCLRDCPYPK